MRVTLIVLAAVLFLPGLIYHLFSGGLWAYLSSVVALVYVILWWTWPVWVFILVIKLLGKWLP
jgi:hypothetical protein